MAILLGETRPVALKGHWCGACDCEHIEPGQRYVRQRVVFEGEALTYKAHPLCDAAYLAVRRETGLTDDDEVVEPFEVREAVGSVLSLALRAPGERKARAK